MRKLLGVTIAALLVSGAVPAMARVAATTNRPSSSDAGLRSPVRRVQPELAQRIASTPPAANLSVVARGTDLGDALAAARRAGLSVSMTFPKVAAFAASGPAAAVARLQRDGAIRYVELDRPLSFFDETSNLATRGQDALDGFTGTRTEVQTSTSRACRNRTRRPCPTTTVTSTVSSAPVDGSGVSIAIVDSGIDGTHDAFKLPDGTSRVVRNLRLACTVNALPEAYDCDGPQGDANDDVFVDVTNAGPANDTDTMALGGHGTHVAGIAAGGLVTTSDGRTFHGAAPGAKLVGLSVGQSLSISGAAAGLNWVLEHQAKPCGEDVPASVCPPIKVVNNSYGTTGDYDPESITAVLGEALVREGVVMVWANGNGDTTGDGGDGSDNRSNPPGQSPVPGIISVANYDDGGTGTRDGTLDSSSSRGLAADKGTYPDLSAPGTNITSACKPTLIICRTVPGPDPDPYYGTISGTSMAAPHVSGIIAQLIQAGRQEGRELTPAQIEDILEDTAYKFSFGAPYVPDLPERNDGTTSFDKGHGLVDAKAAIAKVRRMDLGESAVPPQACLGGVVAVDVAGDGTDPSVDLLSTTMAWDAANGELTTTLRVKDLTDQYPLTYNGYAFYVGFVVDGRSYFVSAERSQFDDAGSFSLGRPDPNAGNVRTSLSSKDMRGSFDSATDTVTIVLKQGAIDEANATLAAEGTPTLPPLADFVFPGISVTSNLERNAYVVASLPAGDTAGSGCQFSVAGSTPGSSPTPPPPPPEPPAPQTAEADLGPGGTYEWDGAVQTGVTDPTVGDPCASDARIFGECEEHRLAVAVPAGGATLTVTITPDLPAYDYDLFVYGPDGKLVGSSASGPLVKGAIGDSGAEPNPASSESVSAAVTVPGLYTVRVSPYTTVESTYRGVATLT